MAIWFFDMGDTTCSWCGSCATDRCGIQSWLVPLFWAKQTIRTVSRTRVKLHF